MSNDDARALIFVDGLTWRNYGKQLLIINAYELAIDAFKNALKKNSDYASDHKFLTDFADANLFAGNIDVAEKLYQDAEDELYELILDMPQHELRQLSYRTNYLKDILDSKQPSVQWIRDPENENAWGFVGYCYTTIYTSRNAVNDFQKIANLNTQLCYYAYETMARVYFDNFYTDLAIDAIYKTIEHKGMIPENLIMLTEAYIYLGKYKDALRVSRYLYSVDSQNIKNIKNICHSLLMTREFTEAEEFILKVKDTPWSDSDFQSLIKFYIEKGEINSRIFQDTIN